IACADGGALYFEKKTGGGTTTDIHAANVYSNGNKLKSALSAKRDVTDYSPDEALSAVMNTDVKKWKYKDSDNSTNSQHIGPIIDDINEVGKKSASIANDMVSTDENGNYYLNESNTISILLAALKKSNRRIDELSYRITQLERKNTQ
ncbi:tail fiber domain-containing protein, partial [Levilactobacillus spicheri]